MARPKKKGAEYFPMDVDFFTDDKIRLLLFEHGMEGVALYIRILCSAYKDGYAYQYDDCSLRLMALDCQIGGDTARAVIATCLDLALFDKRVCDAASVLTSPGIQRRYLEIKRKKINADVKKYGFSCIGDAQIWVLTETETNSVLGDTYDSNKLVLVERDAKKYIIPLRTEQDGEPSDEAENGAELNSCKEKSDNLGFSENNSGFSGVSSEKTTQSKVKKRKEESKEESKDKEKEERKENARAPEGETALSDASSSDDVPKVKIGARGLVQISKHLYDALCSIYGAGAVNYTAEKMEAWLVSGKRYLKPEDTLKQFLEQNANAAITSPPQRVATSKTGWYASQREYTDAELEKLFEVDIDKLNEEG